MNATSAAIRPPVPATRRTPRTLWVVRGAGLFQIVTGLLFWTGNAYALLPLHLLSGLTVVIGLWVIAVTAARAGVPLALAGGAILWGVLVVGLGVTQSGLLPGDLHWIVQAAHLLVGLVAIGMAHSLVARAARVAS